MIVKLLKSLLVISAAILGCVWVASALLCKYSLPPHILTIVAGISMLMAASNIKGAN